MLIQFYCVHVHLCVTVRCVMHSCIIFSWQAHLACILHSKYIHPFELGQVVSSMWKVIKFLFALSLFVSLNNGLNIFLVVMPHCAFVCLSVNLVAWLFTPLHIHCVIRPYSDAHMYFVTCSCLPDSVIV